MSDAPDAAARRKKKKKDRNAVVENVESLIMAVVLALIIRTFIVEAFVIPTGSMADTLYGQHISVTCPNCHYTYAVGVNGVDLEGGLFCPNCGAKPLSIPRSVHGGDRILVNKVLYHFFKPERWSPFVFINPDINPNDHPPRTTYIKRLVGMPDEKFEIIDGDIVVNGTICRKTPSAQKALWVPAYDVRYHWDTGRPWDWPLDSSWRISPADALSVDAPPGREDWIWWIGKLSRRSATDHNIYDDYGYDTRQGPGLNVVTDLRLRFKLNVERPGTLKLDLLCDTHDDVARIDLDAGTATLLRDDRKLDSGKFKVERGESTDVSYYRVDYMLVLAIDGKNIVKYDLWDPDEYRRMVALGERGELDGHTTSGVRMASQGAKLTLSDFRIDRDTYYTPREQTRRDMNHYRLIMIPKDRYLALGDNSPDSYDGRSWGTVPARNLLGKALVTWWPLQRIGLIR